MTITHQHIAVAAALIAVAYLLGKRQAATASAGAAAHNDTVGQAEQWWSYAGTWS